MCPGIKHGKGKKCPKLIARTTLDLEPEYEYVEPINQWNVKPKTCKPLSKEEETQEYVKNMFEANKKFN